MKSYINIIAVILCLTGCKHYVENSGYIEISEQSNLLLKVKSFSNDRGYGIINEKYWLSSNSKLKGNESKIKRFILKKYFKKDYTRPIPRISDLKLPYTILKTANNKQFFVLKEKDSLEFKLAN